MFRVAALLGAACALALAAGGRYFSGVVPEWAAHFAWFTVVLGGSAACGYREPVRPWRWGATIVGVQPVCVFVLLHGELTHPSSSTGGMVAVAIFSVLMALLAPLAMLASYLGSRASPRRRAGRSASP